MSIREALLSSARDGTHPAWLRQAVEEALATYPREMTATDLDCTPSLILGRYHREMVAADLGIVGAAA